MYRIYKKVSVTFCGLLPIIKEMQHMSFMDVIKEVLTSWQVIVVTLVIIIYLSIVSYVSRRYRRPRTMKFGNVNIFKKKAPKSAILHEIHNDMPSTDTNDDLGLEEA